MSVFRPYLLRSSPDSDETGLGRLRKHVRINSACVRADRVRPFKSPLLTCTATANAPSLSRPVQLPDRCQSSLPTSECPRRPAQLFHAVPRRLLKIDLVDQRRRRAPRTQITIRTQLARQNASDPVRHAAISRPTCLRPHESWRIERRRLARRRRPNRPSSPTRRSPAPPSAVWDTQRRPCRVGMLWRACRNPGTRTPPAELTAHAQRATRRTAHHHQVPLDATERNRRVLRPAAWAARPAGSASSRRNTSSEACVMRATQGRTATCTNTTATTDTRTGEGRRWTQRPGARRGKTVCSGPLGRSASDTSPPLHLSCRYDGAPGIRTS